MNKVLKLKIGDYIKSAAKREPEKIGLITEKVRYTYKEMFGYCNSLANGLIKLKVKKGDRVALLLRNGSTIVLSYFGIPRMGAIAVPLNYKMSKDELTYVLNDCTPKILIYGEEYADYIDYFKDKCKSINHYISPDEFEMTIREYSKEGPFDLDGNKIKIRDTDTLYIMYTGGTTGFPKGVMLSHKNITSTMTSSLVRMMQESLNYSEEKKAKQFERMQERKAIIMTDLPIFHAAAMYLVLLAVNGQITLITHKNFDPIQTYKEIEKEKVTILQLVPTMLIRVIDKHDPKYNISSLEMIMYGAAAIDPTTLQKALDIFKGVEFQQVFGMTETAVPVTTLTSEDHELIRDKKTNYLLRSAGKPVYGVEIKIVDLDRKELPIGEVGEIAARGGGVMQGYWNLEEKTKAVIDSDGWYYTGDMGKIDKDGYLYVVDRLKDMIVSGGENIFPAEVENALYSHPAVSICAVVGAPDEVWQEKVVACVVLKKGFQVTDEELIQHCKEKIARYKAPKEIIFRKSLPMSPQGKILKRKLREQFWKGKERKIV
ncbi:MAG: long-chain-fatty-acid--CoA ligase [Candidatus Lokiarchaeota archaeon]|nr:long-chain-fatty-acid--CoA ligase [Candidatus Lokiarchaeota archaeon]